MKRQPNQYVRNLDCHYWVRGTATGKHGPSLEDLDKTSALLISKLLTLIFQFPSNMTKAKNFQTSSNILKDDKKRHH